MDVSKEYVLLKAADRADIAGSGFATQILCGHKWFPSALASIPEASESLACFGWRKHTGLGDPLLTARSLSMTSGTQVFPVTC